MGHWACLMFQVAIQNRPRISESRGQPGMPGPQQHRSSQDPLGSQAWQSWSLLPIDTHESPQAAWYALPGTCRSSGTTVHSPIMTCGHPDPASGKMQRAEGGPSGTTTCYPHSLWASCQPHGIQNGGFLKASKASWSNPRPWQESSTVSLQATKTEVLGDIWMRSWCQIWYSDAPAVTCDLNRDGSVLVHFPSGETEAPRN